MFDDSSLATVFVPSLGEDCQRRRRKEKQKDDLETAPERVWPFKLDQQSCLNQGLE